MKYLETQLPSIDLDKRIVRKASNLFSSEERDSEFKKKNLEKDEFAHFMERMFPLLEKKYDSVLKSFKIELSEFTVDVLLR